MKKSKKGSLVTAALFVTLLIGNYFQYQLSPLAGRLMSEMDITSSQFSVAFSAPMIPAIIFGLVAGVLTDRLGIRRVTTAGLAVTVAGLVLRPFAHTYGQLFACMFLGGVGVAFINVNIAKILGGWYDPEKVGVMVGLAVSGSTVGMTLGTATTALFPNTFSAFMTAAVGAVLVFVLWILVIRDPGKKDDVSEEEPDLKKSLMTVLKNRYIWLTGCILMGIMGCNVAAASFLPSALKTGGISEENAGLLASLVTVGSFLGAVFGPKLIGRFQSSKKGITGFALLTAVCVAFEWQAPVPLAIFLLLVGGFSIGTLMPVCMALPVSLPGIGEKYAGSAGGVVNTLELLGAVVIPSWVLAPAAGQNYTLYFGMAAGIMVIVAGLAFFLPEKTKRL